VIALDKSDMDAIKNAPLLGFDTENSHLSFAAGALSDVDSNGVEAVVLGNARETTAFISDSTPPELLTFAFDINTHTMTLNFDEPVETVACSGVDLTSLAVRCAFDVGEMYTRGCHWSPRQLA
jgi:hypothetical protein